MRPLISISFLLKAATLAATLVTVSLSSACSSDKDSDDDWMKTDAQKKEEASKASAPKKTSFFAALEDKFNTSKVRNKNSDMNHLKNDSFKVFHDGRRSDKLLENNESLSPSYY